MKGKEKTIMVIGAICVLLSVSLIGVTFAFLFGEDAENVLTVGEIDVMLREPNYPSNETDRILVPYRKLNKDPQLINTGTNNCIGFIKLTVPLEESVMITSDRKKEGEASYQEIFRLDVKEGTSGTTRGNLTYNSKWICFKITENDENHTHSYYFGYTDVLKPGSSTEPVFDTVMLKSILENSENLTEHIIAEGYGIQSGDFLDESIDADNLDEENLRKIFTIIENQRGMAE